MDKFCRLKVDIYKAIMCVNLSQKKVVFKANSNSAKGFICLPYEKVLRNLSLTKKGEDSALVEDPLQGRVQWKVNVVKGEICHEI